MHVGQLNSPICIQHAPTFSLSSPFRRSTLFILFALCGPIFRQQYKDAKEKQLHSTGMGLVCENANFCAGETNFPQRDFFCLWWKEIAGYKKQNKQKTGSTDFSSTLNTIKTIEACPCVAMARFSRLIVNTDTAVTLTVRHYAWAQSFLHTSAPCFGWEKANVLKMKDSPCRS